uniref:Uncharacterized protein n=1 Tax=Ciona savignyi TaxID=51511 RepID=H2ZQ19_CIOSA
MRSKSNTEIRKRKTITERYLTRIVQNELFEDSLKVPKLKRKIGRPPKS